MAREGQRATPETSKWTDINPVAAHDTVPTPSDLGISRDQSPEWQELANVPEEDFDAAIEVAKEVTPDSRRPEGPAHGKSHLLSARRR
jgi:hypothetical protein